jgi:predicted transcriptional regulator
MAVEKRVQLKLRPTDPLDAWALAALLRIRVLTPCDVPGLSEACLRTLLHDDPDSWSAVTLRLGRFGDLIILNSAHSPARQASDLAHELAHVLLGHRPTRVDVTEDQQLLLRTYDPNQEDEAAWLAGCLLLPRPALLAIVRGGGLTIEAARRYGVSMDMLAYRLRVTGVELQRRRALQSARRG